MSSLLNTLKSAGTIKGSSILSDAYFFTKKSTTDTKIPIVNMAFSGDPDVGMSTGITIVAGESKSFKTLLSLYCLKAYMEANPESVCLFYDNEYGTTPAYFAGFGIDTGRIIHIPMENVEDLKFDMVSRLESIKKGDKVFIFVDSMGMLASKKEVEDAINEKSVADMTRAKAIRSFFRIVTPHITRLDIPLFIVNHIYKTQEMFSKDVIPGGCVEPTTLICMADGTLKKICEINAGEFVLTLEGKKEVTATWNKDTLFDPEPECYEIEFEDGYKVVCSDVHRFLKETGEWVEAQNIDVGEDFVLLHM